MSQGARKGSLEDQRSRISTGICRRCLRRLRNSGGAWRWIEADRRRRSLDDDVFDCYENHQKEEAAKVSAMMTKDEEYEACYYPCLCLLLVSIKLPSFSHVMPSPYPFAPDTNVNISSDLQLILTGEIGG